jgi:hypothetical protein
MANSNPLRPPPDKLFQKGQSGNPKGKAKGMNFATIIKKALMTDAPISTVEVDGTTTIKVATARDAIVIEQVRRAIKGEIKSVQWLADRSDGRAFQQIEIISSNRAYDTSALPQELQEELMKIEIRRREILMLCHQSEDRFDEEDDES